MQRKAFRNPLGRKAVPIHPIRRVPALSTQEAAAIVLGRIGAWQNVGFRLNEINWQSYCRDIAVLQLVTQELNQGQRHTQEMAS